MKTYRGFEFKRAIILAIHKVCADFGLKPVDVEFDGRVSTACINDSGTIKLCNVKDDAVLTHHDLMRNVGMAVHELLHWMFTDFDATRAAYYEGQYICQLHNALEDAWIETKGIKAKLTGNIEELLTVLIDGMVAESFAYRDSNGDKINWADPVQYPFVLAVYARPHAKTKIPLARGLEPIFAEATKRLNICVNSFDTLNVAKWVFDQLNNLSAEPPKPEDEPVQPPINPTDDGDEDGTQDGSDAPTGGDQGDDQPNPPTDPAKPPTKKDGETVRAREVEPMVNPPDGTGSGGTYSTEDVMRKGYHTRPDAPRTFPINF